jgi:hypothetical protein
MAVASRIKLPVALARSMIQKALFLVIAIVGARACAESPFVIRVVDADTKRGVPLVELKTTHNVRFFTDNSGTVAIDDAGLANEEVFFFVTSHGHGYEYPKDGFGYRGRRLRVEPGKSVELTISRLNVAERLYRVTGVGLYEHALHAGQTPPIEAPKRRSITASSSGFGATPSGSDTPWETFRRRPPLQSCRPMAGSIRTSA